MFIYGFGDITRTPSDAVFKQFIQYTASVNCIKDFVKSINTTYKGLFPIVTYELYRVIIADRLSLVRWFGLKPY